MEMLKNSEEFVTNIIPQHSQLYELDHDPKRKEFLDELFVFMQKRGESTNNLGLLI